MNDYIDLVRIQSNDFILKWRYGTYSGEYGFHDPNEMRQYYFQKSILLWVW